MHEIGQEGYLHVVGPEEENRSFNIVRVKYINLDSVKSVIVN